MIVFFAAISARPTAD